MLVLASSDKRLFPNFTGYGYISDLVVIGVSYWTLGFNCDISLILEI
jgi:hypothetical protein